METNPSSSADEVREIHLRCLVLETEGPFRANGDQLRRCITAIVPDDPTYHHHVDTAARLAAPPVRYVVTGGIPRLVGVDEGLHALEQIYGLPVLTLSDREGRKLVADRELWDVHARIGISPSSRVYRSLSPWIALNQENFRLYQRAPSKEARNILLEKVFVGNVLAMFKHFDLHVSSRVHARVLGCRERTITHKGTDMLGFLVRVETNALLHPWLGLGKLVSKGFGLFDFQRPRKPRSRRPRPHRRWSPI